MAARTLILAASGGCTATLNYNDTTLTATNVTIDNTLGLVAMIFGMNTGLAQSVTVQPGNSSSLTFPSARSVIIGVVRASSLAITGLVSFSLGAA